MTTSGVPELPADGLTFAYFSMEIAIDSAVPTYSGGLGILAGDTLRAAADLNIPAVGITLLHRKGYFRQHLDSTGHQSESEPAWSPERFLELIPHRVLVSLVDRQVQVQAWRYLVRGESGHSVPVYFLDTNLTENSPADRTITDYLYGGDNRYRLFQETVLGMAGVPLLRALGYQRIRAFHMNEGHSALLTLALMEEQTWGRGLQTATSADEEGVRQRCVFTTHTPVASGHDEFPLDLVRQTLGEERTNLLIRNQCCENGVLNMTTLALKFSRYVNGVSMRHEEVSRRLFTNHSIDAITNGVHAPTWTAPSFQRIYDRHIPEWRRDNLYLRYAVGIPLTDIWQAHKEAKQELVTEIERRTGIRLEPGVMTIGLARRATPYKRLDLLFYDLERLRRIVRQVGPIQVVCAGKAHPRDESGKVAIQRIFEAAARLQGAIPVVYLEDYDIAVAQRLCSGVDIWLNTPQKPQEASGTSGMKAALNGVPSLSILDGWWIEGHVEDVTGWSIGDGWRTETDRQAEVESMYDKLEFVILPTFYQRHNAFVSIMRSTIALNGSYFNAQRMLIQYLQNAYRRGGSIQP
ncbi:MAG: alpha-glucan family phosphorylase [Dehalococcoidales bacterium]|nr:alpha-glucan family phosphorylase [Dehalococcoidales bacterium]